MLRPLAGLLHRSGLISYLRAQWRADDASTRRAATDYAAAAAKKAAAGVRAELRDRLERQQAEIGRISSDKGLEELAFQVRRLSEVLAFNSEHRELTHSGAFDASRVAAHVGAAVAAARLQTDPAPHLVIESLLPSETYRAMLDAIPPDSCFTRRDPKKQNFKPGQRQLAPEYCASSWEFFERAIVDAALLPALLRHFDAHVSEAYRGKYGSQADAVATLPLRATGGRLMLRRPGYHLDPHLDPRRVIATCLVYLARSGDNEDFGTQFFRIDGSPAIDRPNTYFPGNHGHQCRLFRTVPFRPNSAVAFLNHGIAHGADIPERAPRSTRRFAYQFYIAPAPAAVAAMTGEVEDTDDQPLESDLQP